MSLHTTVVGPGRPTVLFMHGLFGQGRNWNQVAKALVPQATSLLMDLPNHGHSPWTEHADYVDMADAVARDLRMRLGSAAHLTVVGHSMGGKVAMTMALRHPSLVRGLSVIDIAPDSSSHGYGFGSIVAALQSVDPASVTSREQLSGELADRLPDERVRDFLLQNLRRTRGGFAWQCNLEVLAAALPQISSFPALDGQYDGPVLWIRGERSEYVRSEHFGRMLELFPRTALLAVPDAGHWVHSDQPDAVIDGLRNFLLAEGLDRPLP